jgi:hypothetical protein
MCVNNPAVQNRSNSASSTKLSKGMLILLALPAQGQERSAATCGLAVGETMTAAGVCQSLGSSPNAMVATMTCGTHQGAAACACGQGNDILDPTGLCLDPSVA